MIIKNQEELEILRECGHRLALILDEVKRAVFPGVSTKALDDLAERLILETGGEAVFKGYRTLGAARAYPASLCVSINDEVVHAIPLESRFLAEGDIVGLDIGMRWPSYAPASPMLRWASKVTDGKSAGLITDMAITIGVGKISKGAEGLITTTREALEKGIAVLKSGIRLGDLGLVIQRHIQGRGFGVIRDLAGHGVGRELHEQPFVPNWGRRGSGPFVHEGMVLAIEPMATEHSPAVALDKDGWTFRTRDGGLAAHFEHTVVVTKDGAEILTRM